MSEFDFPTLQEVASRSLNDVQTELPASNPYLPNSYLQALTLSFAGRIYENYNGLRTVFNNLFLPTSSDGFLANWGSIFGFVQKNALPASGQVTVQGTAGTVIPASSILTSSTGNTYTSVGASLIGNNILSVVLNRTGSVVVATTTLAHQYATGVTVTISDAADSDYNGSFVITVLDEFNFSYTISGTPTTPDSGNASADIGTFAVDSEDFGLDQNLDSGSILTFQANIPGVADNQAYTQVTGIIGGQDSETNDEYRDRQLERWRNPIANFNESAIIQQAKLVSGVTRVTVYSVTPTLGAVSVYFLRDNDPIIIPTASEVAQVRASILQIRPFTVSENNVIVEAPIPINIDFVFSSIIPDISTLKEAVIQNLIQFFKDNADVGKNILKQGYDSAIFNTVDPATGETVQSFILNSPTTDINIGFNQIGILNDVTIP